MLIWYARYNTVIQYCLRVYTVCCKEYSTFYLLMFSIGGENCQEKCGYDKARKARTSRLKPLDGGYLIYLIDKKLYKA